MRCSPLRAGWHARERCIGHYDGPRADPLIHAFEGMVDAVETGEVGNTLGDREPASGCQCRQLRDVRGRIARTVEAALETLVRQELDSGHWDLESDRGQADDHRAPPSAKDVPGRPDGGGDYDH